MLKKPSLLAALLLVGCASPTIKAPWRQYSGAGVEGKCDPYALAAQKDLTSRGVAAYYTIYGWRARGSTRAFYSRTKRAGG